MCSGDCRAGVSREDPTATGLCGQLCPWTRLWSHSPMAAKAPVSPMSSPGSQPLSELPRGVRARSRGPGLWGSWGKPQVRPRVSTQGQELHREQGAVQ